VPRVIADRSAAVRASPDCADRHPVADFDGLANFVGGRDRRTALTVDHPTVTISPSTNLRDGQTVEVRVTGFGVGVKVFLSECAATMAVTDLG